MGVVDRTCEFRQVLMELSSKGCAAGVCSLSGPVPQAQSELNAWSAEIGSQIHQTSLKVHELRKMAKRKGIFEDKTSEIQELTHNVKEDIGMLNQKLDALERRAKGAGPNRNHQAHSFNVVETLRTRLLGVTQDFNGALDVWTRALEQQDTRRSLYCAGQGPGTHMPGQRSVPAPSGRAEDLEGGPGAAQAVALQRGYLASRAEAAQSVQRTIGEVAQVLQKMAAVVARQEEMVQSICHDVDSASDNVTAGQDDLLRYFHHISSNRGLIIKVFLIIFIFVVFFVVFLA